MKINIKNKKIIVIVGVLVLVFVIGAVLCFAFTGRNKHYQEEGQEETSTEVEEVTQPKSTTVYVDNKVDIINVNSKTRPFAVSINNTPVAVQVQTGLNRAYIVYEIPTEGYTCRLLALYKIEDKEVSMEADENLVGSGNVSNSDVIVGTVRSARHNFLDFCFESDAIFVHFGASTWAEEDEAKTGINWINGFYNDEYYWRINPESLATEHTAYTSIARLKRAAKEKGFKTESDNADNTVLLNYNVSDADLSKKSDAVSCFKVTIPYSDYQYTTFVYDGESGNYLRYANGEACIDHETKEQCNTRNIIVQKITHTFMSDNYCWDLKTVGSGEGYYITKGYAVPIKWSKNSRTEKTVYTYMDGTEIDVSDGRTYIEVSDMGTTVTIE
ncbi:MAG: DUF3048 domain-containing protein [Eubacteriales bacterium]|nr:DUF3048 domain-containing protein [Eubacteriales bacterium]